MSDDFTPCTDELLENNRAFAAERFDPSVAGAPTRHLAVVACMDCRLDVEVLLGLGPGEAHVIRNAGGIVSDDVVRSLVLSQRALGTREIVLVHHSSCGVQGLDEGALYEQLVAETGMRPTWSTQGFADVDDDVRQSLTTLRTCPFLPHTDHIRGFVYDVGTGLLREITD